MPPIFLKEVLQFGEEALLFFFHRFWLDRGFRFRLRYCGMGEGPFAGAEGRRGGEGGHPEYRRCHDFRLHHRRMVHGGVGFAPAVGDVVVGLGGGVRHVPVGNVPCAVEVLSPEPFQKHGAHHLGRKVGEGKPRRQAGDGGEKRGLHIVHGHPEFLPNLVHEEDHALLGGEEVFVGDQVILISHARHVHEEHQVQVGQGAAVVVGPEVEVRHGVVGIPEFRPFAGHGIKVDFLLERPAQDVPGGKRLAPLGQGILGFPDFPFREAVAFPNIQHVGHVVADFRFALLREDVDFRHSMGVVFLGDLGNHPARELCMGAFAGQAVALQEIGEHFVRQHVHRLLGAARPDPAVRHEFVDPVVRIAAVDIQFIGRHAMVHRLAVEVVQDQDIPHR